MSSGTGTPSINALADGKSAASGSAFGSGYNTAALSTSKDLFIDSTIVRTHQNAAGVPKNGGQQAQALGRSRGGLSANLHATCIDENAPASRSR